MRVGIEATMWVVCILLCVACIFWAGRTSVQVDHNLECSPEIATIVAMELEIEELGNASISSPIPESTKCVDRERELCNKRILKTKELMQALKCKICGLAENPEDG